MDSLKRLKVVDAHAHLYDHAENRYEFLERVDPMFEALIGDYAVLPRRYLLEDYMADEPDVAVDGLIWHEFLSDDPVREVRWAQRMVEQVSVPMAIVGLVDFLAPDLEERLEAYTQCPNVAGVREHLGWDESNPMRRFAKRGDLLTDPRWQEGLRRLARYRFRCSLEVFSPQLPELLRVVQLNPNIGFTIAVMGWPIATDKATFTQWRKSIAELGACDNVRIVISALECVFGMGWSLRVAQPWVDAVFELFGTERTMFGSHHPLCGLSRSFPRSYVAYRKLASALSETEQDAVFRLNAQRWFIEGLPR
jgi:predicted TIM-barrel fold metal-dependent hydrolase